MVAMTTIATKQWWQFLKGFLRAPRSVGSVAPSSHWLVQAMLNEAKIETARVIIEYGPGTGVFTDEIVRRLRPDAHLLVFEVNPQFYADLHARITDPRVHLILGSAAEVGDYLERFGLNAPECIVSGLPFTSLPRPVTHQILSATYHALRPNGVFVTYQYTPILRKLLKAHFDSTRITRFVLRNLPPALVFVCRKSP
jgi:phospholipid N-methyltransferase